MGRLGITLIDPIVKTTNTVLDILWNVLYLADLSAGPVCGIFREVVHVVLHAVLVLFVVVIYRIY
jgi:hypothetical protein